MAVLVGITPLVVGLTVVAFGTSAPELAVGILSSLSGRGDLAVGNVVGSNLFNLLAVLGAAGMAVPGGLSIPGEVVRFDLAVMTAAVVTCLSVFFSGHRIDRWEGTLFLSYYITYTVWIVPAALSHPALISFSRVMLFFALPLTAVTLLVITVRALRPRRPPG
ncbi:MAG: hypothetical protein R6W82_08775 [bacterium]